MNPDCSKMILYANQKGHKISVFTTLSGMTLLDIDLIESINFGFFQIWRNSTFNSRSLHCGILQQIQILSVFFLPSILLKTLLSIPKYRTFLVMILIFTALWIQFSIEYALLNLLSNFFTARSLCSFHIQMKCPPWFMPTSRVK